MDGSTARANAVIPQRDGGPTISANTVVLGSDLDSVARAVACSFRCAASTADDLVSSFTDARGSSRRHEAIDILAPRGTDVLAVEDGKIAKIFTSDAGGLTLYQFDPSETFVYYYAHLDSYAPGLKEGMMLRKGDVVGTVGTTGNAPKNTPHLHFAIAKLDPDKQWWGGTALDPFLVWRGPSGITLFLSEAIEIPVAASRDQVGLAAALAGVRGVPRRVAAAGAVEVTDLRRASRIARPVVAGAIFARRERASRGGRARQNVVLIQRLSFMRPCRRRQAPACLFSVSAVVFVRLLPSCASFDRVAMQVRDIARDDATAGIGPRTLADAIARVDGVRSLRAQVRAPDPVARAGLSGRSRELLAMRVGALETAEISRHPPTDAGHEEPHRLRGRFRARRLLCGENRSGHNGCGTGKNKNTSLHLDLLVKSRRVLTRQVLQLMVPA